MNKEQTRKSPLIRYGVCAVVATALLFLILQLNGFWKLTEPQDRLRVLCDAFSIPGALLILASGLVFARNAGAFNGLFYGLRTAKEIFLPFLPHEHVKYQEYLKKREEKRIKGYGFIFFTGLAFLTVGMILLVIFHVKYP